MTRDPRLYSPSEGSRTQDFYALKKSIDPGWDRTRETRIQRRVWQPLHHSHPHYPTLSLYLRRSSFSSLSVASPTSQLILQSLFRFSYVTGSSPTPQLILQPFRRFAYVTAHSPTLLSLFYVIGSSLTSPGGPPMMYLSQQRHVVASLCMISHRVWG